MSKYKMPRFAPAVGIAALAILAAAGAVFAQPPVPEESDLRLLAMEPDDVIRVGVSLADAEPYVLVQRKGEWSMKDPSDQPEGFDSQSAADFVARLVHLEAARFEEPTGKAEEALGPRRDVFRLTSRHGPSEVLHVGPVAQGRCLVWRAGGEKLAEVPEEVVAELRKLPTDFR